MPGWTRLKEAESMVLLIDNYDSFTYNLAQYFGELGCELLVKRNDEISAAEIATLAPRHICISPGPCTPREAGMSKEVILRFGRQIPILGVCLGHQCIAEAYGGKVVRARRLMHGKSSMIRHNGSPLFSRNLLRMAKRRFQHSRNSIAAVTVSFLNQPRKMTCRVDFRSLESTHGSSYKATDAKSASRNAASSNASKRRQTLSMKSAN